MPSKALLLVHGMGNHTAPTADARGSFGRQVIDTCNLALKRYPKHQGKGIEDYVDIVEFNYNKWFDEVRARMKEKADSVHKRLSGIAGHYNVTFPIDLVGELASLESKFGNNTFFYTHWLDVIFYSTILGAKVRVDAGREVARLVAKYGAGNVHVMAHSLGSAVMHDTLSLLYRPETDLEDEIPDLSITNHKLASVWMVANVSRLLNAATKLSDPLRSVVKPGDDGCAIVFNSVRHELDPFTWVSRFSPKNNGKWVSEYAYDAYYLDIVNSLVTNGDTHDITQYLEDPNVSEALFSQIFKLKASNTDLEKAREQYRKKSIQGAYALLETEFKDLKIRGFESWQDFFSAGKGLSGAIKLIKEQLP